MDLKKLAEEAREYCETIQNREFELEGACHENVIGAATYLYDNTEYQPIIVWGVVSHGDDAADSISEVCETTTHFWVELETEEGIIDVYTNNPLVGDTSEYVESGIAYGGEQPECYNMVEKFKFEGIVDSHDLTHKDNFAFVRERVHMM